MHNTFCSEGIYEFYSLVTFAVGVQPDVKMNAVEMVQ